jgi:hypothetical protein
MAGNDSIDRLLSELGGILERNRREREVKDRAEMAKQQGFSNPMESGYGGDPVSPYRITPSRPQPAHVTGTDNAVSGYGKDQVGPYRIGHDDMRHAYDNPMRPAHSTNISEAYLRAHQPSKYDSSGYMKHQNKMYRGDENDGLGPLAKSYRSHDDAGFRSDFLKTQQASAGVPQVPTMSPYAQGGQPAQDAALAAQVQAAGNPNMGNFGHILSDMQPGVPAQAPQPMPAAPGQPPAGWSKADYDYLTALSQKYPQQ